MKRFLLALMILMLMTSAAAANPVRIARLPIIFNSTIPDYDTCAELETKLARASHIPMNKTLQVAEYLPTKDSTQALQNLWQEMRSANKKARLQDAMRPLAQNLDADIIICPILLSYSQHVENFAGFETYLQSYVKVELIVYDRRADSLVDKKAAQMYHDAISTTGTADYLAKICFDKVIDETKLRELIMNIK
ncbi:MAG: hypothetical protein IJP68_07855 [Selenomonadaceae bacterium]|nr:hypothetical protein [Selenomonadaceae bacterium]